MKANLKNFALNLGADTVFGLLASLFVKIIVKMLPTILQAILPPLIYNAEQWNNIVSILGFWQIFAILFGIRFIVAYVTGNYKFNPALSYNEKILKKFEM